MPCFGSSASSPGEAGSLVRIAHEIRAVAVFLDDRQQRFAMAGFRRGMQCRLTLGEVDACVRIAPVDCEEQEVRLRHPLARKPLDAPGQCRIEPVAEGDLGPEPLEPEPLLVGPSLGRELARIGHGTERFELEQRPEELAELDRRLGCRRVERSRGALVAGGDRGEEPSSFSLSDCA